MVLRVAVIGAGPAGMSQLAAFAGTNVEVICFEKQSEVGGLWVYNWRTGLDEYGEQVHNSMYRQLFINEPKELLEYPDFTFKECFTNHQPSFVRRDVIHDYLKKRCEKMGMMKYIRLETSVQQVTLDEATQKFTILSKHLPTGKISREVFDYVIVATGHFSTPHFPYYKGLEKIARARLIHAHDFRNPQEFKGKNVFIVGSSYSAEDIASMAWKFGARQIYVSSRNPMPPYEGWPSNIHQVKCLQEVQVIDDEECLLLTDGTKVEKIDHIIFCTGYKHHFPFIEDKLVLHTNNILYPTQLYKGVFLKNHPNMMYLGMQNQWLSFAMFDPQAWLARDYCLGRFSMPDLQTMEADIATWVDRERKLMEIPAMIRFQIDYIWEAAGLTDYNARIDEDGNPIIPLPADKAEALLNEWVGYKMKNIMTFRDQQYRNAYTDELAPPVPTKWADLLVREKDQI
jgi:trimethylamine monooxygenase